MSANDVLVPFTHSSVANTPEFRILNDDTGLWVIALNVTLYLHLSQLQGFVTMPGCFVRGCHPACFLST